MNIAAQRGALQSTSSLDSAGSSDCSYSKIYPETGKSYERSLPYQAEPIKSYELPKSYVESIKCPLDHQSRSYESLEKYEIPAAKTYIEAKSHQVPSSSRYPQLPARTYEAKYAESKNYPDGFKYPEVGNSANKSYACVHAQYYPAPEAYPIHEDNEYQSQGMPAHSFYPYISASMTQPPYYMGPR